MKAPMDLFDQFRCGAQVDLRGMDIHMAHIGCKPRKPCVHILSVPIPSQESMNCEGVPDVVYSGAGVLVVMDSALPQQMPEALIDRAVVQTAGSLVDKERRVGRSWCHLQAFTHVVLQSSAGGFTQGHPAGLSELALGYIEPLLGEMEVLQVQGQGLTDPDSRAVEKAQQRAVAVRPEGVFRRQLGGCRH